LSGYSRILEEAAKRSDFEPDVRFFLEIWEAILPDAFAQHSRPCGWSKDTLHVEVDASWIDEFRHHERRLLGRLSRALPWPVLQMVLIEGTIEKVSKTREEQAPAPVKPSVEVPDLGDRELNRLAQLIGAHVARATKNE